ncbi:PA2928 family protein [Luteimonas sp. TWI662]|uniref:PA2928 family protein n=1 Tax=Luteimonas sp. TWI662 TaxID=3136789 RepID=UPI0032098C9B
MFKTVAAVGLGLALVAGLPLLVSWQLSRYADSRIQSGPLLLDDASAPQMAFVLEDTRAHAVENGIVRSRSRQYAQVVDMRDGRLLWSRRLDAEDAQGRDWGRGALLGASQRYLFAWRNAVYAFGRADGHREKPDGPLAAPVERARYDAQAGQLAVVDVQGRTWRIDGDTLAATAADEIDPATLFEKADPGMAAPALASASAAVDADGSWTLLATPAQAQAVAAGRERAGDDMLDVRRQMLRGRLDWRSPQTNRFAPVGEAVFIRGVFLRDPVRAPLAVDTALSQVGPEHDVPKPESPRMPHFGREPSDFPNEAAYRQARARYRAQLPAALRQFSAEQSEYTRAMAAYRAQRQQANAQARQTRAARNAYVNAMRGLLRHAPLAADNALWTVGAARDRLVLHATHAARGAPQLLSAVGEDGQVRWTLALEVERLDAIWRARDGALLAVGRSDDARSDVLLRVEPGSGTGWRYLARTRDTQPLAPGAPASEATR